MYDATDNIPTADEIIAAVHSLQHERDELRAQMDEASADLDGLRRQLKEATKDELVIRMIDLPTGRGWAFVEDAKLLAISPDLDDATKARLLAQVEPPKLTTCGTCGAPVYEGNECTMH